MFIQFVLKNMFCFSMKAISDAHIKNSEPLRKVAAGISDLLNALKHLGVFANEACR